MMYLHTGNAINPHTREEAEMPWAYTELILCRDVYHCAPSVLGEQDWETVQTHLAIMRVEQEVRQLKQQ